LVQITKALAMPPPGKVRGKLLTLGAGIGSMAGSLAVGAPVVSNPFVIAAVGFASGLVAPTRLTPVRRVIRTVVLAAAVVGTNAIAHPEGLTLVSGAGDVMFVAGVSAAGGAASDLARGVE
jgi:hypothetical protein